MQNLLLIFLIFSFPMAWAIDVSARWRRPPEGFQRIMRQARNLSVVAGAVSGLTLAILYLVNGKLNIHY